MEDQMQGVQNAGPKTEKC